MGDALAALKSVMLMQGRIDGLRRDLTQITQDLRALTEKVQTIDSRVAKIEGMIEMALRGGAQPRIEG